jgi:3-methyladenine DNA glycosylase/8-oxoguanine DNA glycosylase
LPAAKGSGRLISAPTLWSKIINGILAQKSRRKEVKALAKYECKACGMTFKTAAELKEHNRKVHGK